MNADTPPPEPSDFTSEDAAPEANPHVRDILSAVTGQLDQLQKIQCEHDAQALALEERERSLIEREEGLETERQTLIGHQDRLTAELAVVEEERATLEVARTTFSEDHLRLDADRSRLDELQAELDQHRAAFDEDLVARLAHERECVVADRTAMEEAEHARLDESTRRIEELDGRCQNLDRELTETNERARQLEQDGLELAQEVETERDAVRAELDETKTLLERVTEECDGLREEIDQLRAAAEAAGGPDADTQELAVLREANEALQNELEMLRAAAESRDAAGEPDLDTPELAALREANEALQNELETLRAAEESRDAAGPDADTQELAALREANEALQNELETLRASAAPSDDDDDAEHLQRIETLERELAEAQARAETNDGVEPADIAALREDFRGKAARLADVAEHLQRRRVRLARVRLLRRDRPASPNPQDASLDKRTAEARQQYADQVRRLEQLRHELEESRNTMAKKERRMRSRWARPRAVATAAWIMVLIMIAAGVSWLVANSVAPSTVTASVMLKAKTSSRRPLDDKAAARWQKWHTDVLRDKTFLRTLANRMRERKLPQFSRTTALQQRMTEDLGVDSLQRGMLTLTLAGGDMGEMRHFLDILATTLSAESVRQLKKRPGTAWAVVQGERREGGQLCYSTPNAGTLDDQRLIYAAPTFLLTGAVMLIVVGTAYRRLVQAKLEFDDDGNLFTDAEVGEYGVTKVARI